MTSAGPAAGGAEGLPDWSRRPANLANALAGELVKYRIDGFQAWRYEDKDGKWRMLRDHG